MLLADQRHGELLKLESIDHNTITLETTNVAGMRDRYQGTLSADGSTLLGELGWDSRTDSQRVLSLSPRPVGPLHLER